ncbi:hypothetical protein, partial [Aquiflexum sp.]|uniref:hypothetical protein n=1 Tax=Aquiflexum sp. TaxID=1872584 RepID=UPI00359364B3
MKKIVLLIIIFSTHFSIHGQEDKIDTISVKPKSFTAFGAESGPSTPTFDELVTIPKSPEASAFQKYGNTPISYFEGSPNISIPIGKLKGRDITLNIDLNYDASGIKVDQNATDVGLGWNLNVGGMIVRQVNGMPDDYITATPAYYPHYSVFNYPGTGESVFNQFNFFINNNVSSGGFVNRTPIGSTNWEAQWPVRYVRFMEEVSQGKIDSQPDTYTFSINGLNGTLVIDYVTSTGYCIEHPDMKVGVSFNSGVLGVKQIDSWILIDGGGNTYHFGGSNANETTFHYENNALEVSRQYTSGWKIKKIVTGKLKETVDFNYTPESWTNDQPIISYYAMDNTPSGECQNFGTTLNLNPFYKISSFQLTSIKFLSEPNPRLNIFRKSRLDLPGQSAIDYMRINDEYGSPINFIKFNT